MTPSEIRFAADGMLLSLGTWLRLLGYDCVGGATFGRRLLEQAAAEQRVFLTRNVHLPEYLPRALLEVAPPLVLTAETLPGQLREVTGRFALDTERFLFSRCLRCNEPLQPVPPTDASARVPAAVRERREAFWQCPRCERVYWHGSHVDNSLRRLRLWLHATGS